MGLSKDATVGAMSCELIVTLTALVVTTTGTPALSVRFNIKFQIPVGELVFVKKVKLRDVPPGILE
jgi:hypothetical protein